MNRFTQVLTGIILVLLVIPGLYAQEVITPLFGNARATSLQRHEASVKKSTAEKILELPFFDDFSNTFVTPDTGYWSDAGAFINNQYCIDPVTNGVATLDAQDFDGSIYSSAVISPSTFVADHLTSHPIRMEYPASDSIYLSFLYQPQGRGDMPDAKDSLLVDFFDPALESWNNVWGVPGDTLHRFTHVMIPVTDARYLTGGFRFRFRNRASLPRNNDYPDKRANVDHWNVDYVRLDRNRVASDTLMRDVAFNEPLNSILRDLTSLPWAHFEQAYNTVLDPTLTVGYRNNDSITRNVTRSLTIIETIYNESHNPGVPTAQDLPALTDTSVNFGYIYPLDFNRGDSAIIRYKVSLRTDEFDPKVNDTVIYDQVFSDYWSYDDRTPEAGYGLRGQGTRNASVAMKYESYVPDLIGGVDIYFNQVYDSVNLDYYFKLMVWSDSEGHPGPAIHEDSKDYTPVYTARYPDFTRYYFSSPVHVDGTFYVGWKQFNEFMLNVGLDLNNRPASPVMFYNFQGPWEPSRAPGVMMFRPFLYDETTAVNPFSPKSGSLHVYPNPAVDRIYFELPGHAHGDQVHLQMFDASGRMVIQEMSSSNNLNIAQLPPGIYYLRAGSNETIYSAKILINP